MTAVATGLPGLLPELAVLRQDFPILSRTLADGKPLVYLDSANTSQKPQVVIDAMVDHLERHNANVARAMHQLGAEASEAFESARDQVAAFIGAPSRDEVVFTKNATEALNLVANTLAWARGPLAVGEGDEVVITEMEHHSNIVPWQLLTERTGATLRWFGLTEDGHLDLSDLDSLITERTKVVSLTWVSNMLGTINPVAEIARRAHEVGALVVVDASQAAPQLPVDVVASGADFLAFTGHKVVGPTGIGVLWGRRELLAQLPPFMGGGEMIETVTMARSTYAGPPHRFEAGTPPITEAVGLGAAVDYLGAIGMEAIHRHEQAITAYALDGLATVPGLRVLGPLDAAERGGAISFELAGVHPHDISQVLDSLGIAVRAGHHCAKPAHLRYGVQSTTRMSSYLYTTPAEIDALIEGLEYTRSYFGWAEAMTTASNLDALYKEIILDHYKNPHGAGLRDPFEAEVHHVNPTCGDEVTLRVHVADSGDGPVVADVSYDAVGCSISQASASVLNDLVVGKSVTDALRVQAEFQRLMQGKGTVEPDEDVLEDGIAFAGVAQFPARVKCALLAWMAWKDATVTAVAATSTSTPTSSVEEVAQQPPRDHLVEDLHG